MPIWKVPLAIQAGQLVAERIRENHEVQDPFPDNEPWPERNNPSLPSEDRFRSILPDDVLDQPDAVVPDELLREWHQQRQEGIESRPGVEMEQVVDPFPDEEPWPERSPWDLKRERVNEKIEWFNQRQEQEQSSSGGSLFQGGQGRNLVRQSGSYAQEFDDAADQALASTSDYGQDAPDVTQGSTSESAYDTGIEM